MPAVISLSELRKRIESGRSLIIIEALPRNYFIAGHIPGAINIPHDANDDRIREIIRNPNAEIVVYCANAPCKNSGILASRLAALGYSNVADYHEGKAEWSSLGLPLEGGEI